MRRYRGAVQPAQHEELARRVYAYLPETILGHHRMTRHPVELQIEKADLAINREDFDAVMDIYSDDAVLVVKPGTNAVGKIEIRKAMEAIAAYFDHSLDVKQAGMKILESNDTALVLAKTVVSAANMPAIERNATYVFKRAPNGAWLCVIDNSYGHELLHNQDC
jgi:uncharacterized protein (TIGR02246 family)